MSDLTLFRPRKKPEPKAVRYISGTKRSQNILLSLGFDPITELVIQYRKLEEEMDRHEQHRDGTLVVLSKSSGRPLAYNAEMHMSIYDKLFAISEKLLRYKYGRVPEMAQLEKRKPTPLIVQLTAAGEQYVIGDDGADYKDMPDDVAQDADDWGNDDD